MKKDDFLVQGGWMKYSLFLLLFCCAVYGMETEKHIKWDDGVKKPGKEEVPDPIEMTKLTPIGSVPKVPSDNSQKAMNDRDVIETPHIKPLGAKLPTREELATSICCPQCYIDRKESWSCVLCVGCFQACADTFFSDCCFKGRPYREYVNK
jgi:hypothetical protein